MVQVFFTLIYNYDTDEETEGDKHLEIPQMERAERRLHVRSVKIGQPDFKELHT
jgi:hypothetical protein